MVVDFCRFIPENVTQFMYDTRLTSNVTFIDNVMALYGDLYMRKRNCTPCFEKLFLIVSDFCLPKAFDVQLQRLAEMILDKPSAYAIVLTTMPGDDSILQSLLHHKFRRARPGHFLNFNRCYEKYDYWRSCINGKTIVLGFLDRNVPPKLETHSALE
uniref:Uncharacterized protein n=1 Tax=Panagrolaimus sp. ES5 TaxID=591445 RepID=A0AC34FQX4_9BILA